jgi:hypothetical protein
MDTKGNNASLEELQDIRSIMDRSARFVSLSGMSGIWAGGVALIGSFIAYQLLQKPDYQYIGRPLTGTPEFFDKFTLNLVLLGIGVFVVALAGAFYFTYKKAKKHSHTLWNNASRQLLIQGFFPLLAGGVFSVAFIYYGCGMFVAPVCLVFYGLALISGSRHTLSDIRYMGMLEVVLGCSALFFPGFGLYFWAIGFGILHIFYGAMMWNKYDK